MTDLHTNNLSKFTESPQSSVCVCVFCESSGKLYVCLPLVLRGFNLTIVEDLITNYLHWTSPVFTCITSEVAWHILISLSRKRDEGPDQTSQLSLRWAFSQKMSAAGGSLSVIIFTTKSRPAPTLNANSLDHNENYCLLWWSFNITTHQQLTVTKQLRWSDRSLILLKWNLCSVNESNIWNTKKVTRIMLNCPFSTHSVNKNELKFDFMHLQIQDNVATVVSYHNSSVLEIGVSFQRDNLKGEINTAYCALSIFKWPIWTLEILQNLPLCTSSVKQLLGGG